MKKTDRLFSALLSILLLLQFQLIAQDEKENQNQHDNNKKKYEFVKRKALNKSYNVSSADKLNIKNSFGSVEVHTWDRSEIKVDVNIEVTANTDTYAQKIIDRISVSDSKDANEIYFKTSIKDLNNSKDEKSTMAVNYTISMPSSNPLHISNEFGSTTIPDYQGEVDLTSKFGSLTTGVLNHVKNIDVEFGKGVFQSISNGTVTVKYSKAEFSKVVGNIKMNLEFCGITKINMDNRLSDLDIHASYSSVNLRPQGDLPATYTFNTSFGSLKNNTNIKFENDNNNEDNGPKFDHKYSGRSGSGNINIKVNSNFGKIILGEPGPDDMKDKGKPKMKTKTV